MAAATHITVRCDAVMVRKDLYPRLEHIPELVQQYAETFDLLPPIEINQNNILIDGYHRLTAAQKLERETIRAVVTETASELQILRLAARRNAADIYQKKAGVQLKQADKRDVAQRIYHGTPLKEKEKIKEEIARDLGVDERTVREWTARIDKDSKEKRSKQIFDMWLACYTQGDIAGAVGLTQKAISEEIKESYLLADLPKGMKVLGDFADEAFDPPLYDIWKFKEKSHGAKHFGNSEPQILERLLYLYTQPFDIVVDPFGGGGSTIDVCKRRLRRYWVGDRKPVVERKEHIRQHDIKDGVPPLARNWSLVKLVYLDPPYWKQAEGQYSKDSDDLANMPLETFYSMLGGFLKELTRRLSPGAVIAMLMQPTQWHAPNRQVVDHVVDIIRIADKAKLPYYRRISCPYESQQANAQMVEWAKANKDVLVLSRELILWRMP